LNAVVADIARIGYSLVPLQLAYHEIGHALIAHRCGRTIGRIEVNSHGGRMHSEGVSSPLIGLLCAISGDRAEYLAPGSVPALVGFGHNQDQADANFALDVIGGDQLHRDFVLQDATVEVDKVLLEQRDRLDQLARMLLRHQSLEGRQFAALLE
jgi:hypothetical protein